jgi:CheY-like chemotaxis protein
MSFPFNLQPLVIEDEDRSKEAYEEIFKNLRGEHAELPFCPVPPCFAFSYEDAIEHLESSKIFHIVILDLRLPEKRKLPPADGVDLGLNLLNRFIHRDRYPVPALLVISGHIGSTEQNRLKDSLRNGFYYGRDFVKGDYNLLEGEIRQACASAIRYCSVGIHLRDARDEVFPTITPREEDLLRRSTLAQEGGIGLDLNWWSAKRSPELSNSGVVEENPWTKVLMGRYLLDGGRGATKPKFFKMMAGADAEFVVESARYLEHKLTHVKLTSAVSSKSTALIVTEKVGAHEARPTSLEEFFKQATPKQAYDVACQIAKQVQQLGEVLPESKALKSLLWPALDSSVLAEQWNVHKEEVLKLIGSDVDPVALMKEISRCDDRVRLKEFSVVHGDLHVSNVALDVDHQNVSAYIFDAGVTKQNVAGRDLAVLEVSAVLHQRFDLNKVVQLCGAVYGDRYEMPDAGGDALGEPVSGCTVEFIRGLRASAKSWNEPEVYALMVLDFALIQLQGLAFGSSANRIWDRRSAAYLLGVVTQWYEKHHKWNKQGGAVT